jgi:hypothetical protein
MRGSFPFATLEGQDDGEKQTTATAKEKAGAKENARVAWRMRAWRFVGCRREWVY